MKQKRITEAENYTRFIDEIPESRVIGNESQIPWFGKIETFIEGLRGLEAQNQLTEQNIAALHQPSTIPEGFVLPANLETGAHVLRQGRC